MRPRARRDGLIVEELPDEVLVYDLERDRAHCLNDSAMAVWRHCNGRRGVPELTRRVSRELGSKVDESWVRVALGRLGRAHLLNDKVEPATPVSTARRKLLAAMAALPVVLSIVSPPAAAAANCLAPGSCCSPGDKCCTVGTVKYHCAACSGAKIEFKACIPNGTKCALLGCSGK